MTDAAATQTTEPTPEAPKTSRFQQALSMLTSAPTRAQEAAPPPAEEKPPEAEAAPAPAAKPVDDLEAAREQQKYLRYQREAVEAKKRAQELEERLKGYDIFDGKDPRAIAKALKDRGVTLEQLAKSVMDAPDEPDDDPVEALRKELEALKAEKEAEKTAAQEREQYDANLKVVDETLSAGTESYPLISAWPSARPIILKRAQAHFEQHNEVPDLNELAKAYNEECLDDLGKMFSSDAALKAFLTRPEVKSRALEVLGAKHTASPASDQGSAKGNGAPSSIPNRAAGEGARKARPQSRDERFQAALGLLKKG